MTIIIIAITTIVSIISFQNDRLFSILLLNPLKFLRKKEYYRILSHGFIHADWMHLIVNMFVLFSFGRAIEGYFDQLKEMDYLRYPHLHYLALYIGGIIVSSIPSIIKHRNDSWYNSVGASGGVSAVVFASIFFGPLNILYLYFIPIPGIVFGALYLIYSQYMAKRNKDNINHDAHFAGSVYGFLYPLLINIGLFKVFLNQLSF